MSKSKFERMGLWRSVEGQVLLRIAVGEVIVPARAVMEGATFSVNQECCWTGVGWLTGIGGEYASLDASCRANAASASSWRRSSSSNSRASCQASSSSVNCVAMSEYNEKRGVEARVKNRGVARGEWFA